MTIPAALQEINALSSLSEDRIGGKGKGLVQLYELGLPVPPAWVIPTEVYLNLLSSLNLGSQLGALEQAQNSEPSRERLVAVQEAILAAPLPEGFSAQIQEIFRVGAKEFGGGIIVRSSATVEDSVHHSFAGIFESIPCYSVAEAENAIRQVWASVFSSRAFAYYRIASLTQLPAMAVILQPFVEAYYSGVMFTRFANPNRVPQILVEYVPGSGDKLVTGQVNPERFWLPRWSTEVRDVPETVGPLGAPVALELSQVAQKLEQKLERPQDVEWCVRAGQLYILQTRPITAESEATNPIIEGEILLEGVAASSGQGSGPVHLVFNIENADALQTGQVLVTTMTNPDMVPSMQRSAAVVTDVGGMICHAAIVSRELGIPCVVGTKVATQILTTDTLVTVDGSTGVVFQGLIASQQATWPARQPGWFDLWHEWQMAVPADAIPLISTIHALADIPPGMSRCVLDPFCDLILDPCAEISSLASLAEATRNELFRSYAERLNESLSQTSLKAVFLDLHRLDTEIRHQLSAFLAPIPLVRPLQPVSGHGSWQVQAAPDSQLFALLEKPGAQIWPTAPADAVVAVPLGFGRLLGEALVQMPEAKTKEPGGVFGMMPEARMARIPAPERRQAMHQLIPALSQAHGGQVPASEQLFPWLDLRSEVIITPFLKAFVTPGVEAIPYVMGFADPPLYIQFIFCRFHFRQDTLFGFLPKLMMATWDEEFLSNMLIRCRASYENLERHSEGLPANETALAEADNLMLRSQFVAWWNAFSEFFSLSFFIQAQGDDAVFPVLGTMAESHAALLASNRPDWQVPSLVQLSAPVAPVLTADYIKELMELKQALQAQGLHNIAEAQQAIGRADRPELNSLLQRVRDRWHWMRERDPYYDPLDSEAAILEKAFSIRSTPPPFIPPTGGDERGGRAQAELALALHFDLARVAGNPEKLVYAIKYGRALALDRENHHIIWLRASYRLRQLLLEWERRLNVQGQLAHRDIFFMQPWEILDAVAALPQPISGEFLERIRNRRAAYEQEIKLKAGQDTPLKLQREEDYY